MFRTKNRKPTLGDNRVTVDAKHNEMLKHFEEQRKKLPEKCGELEKSESEYDDLKKISNKDLNNEQLSRKFFLEDKISSLKEEIDNIENNRDELKYFMDTGHLLYDYYENIQNISKSKNSISSTHSSPNNLSSLQQNSSQTSTIMSSNSIAIPNAKQHTTQHSGKCETKISINSPEKEVNHIYETKKGKKKDIKNIMQFLSTGSSPPTNSSTENASSISSAKNYNDDKNNKDNKNNACEGTSLTSQTENQPNTPLLNFRGEGSTENFQRSKYRDQYLKIIDPNFVIKIEHDEDCNFCEECGCEKNIIASEGIMVCESCGLTDLIVIDSERPSYREPPPEVSYFAYKRMNHFNELLNQTQGKETTEIPQNVITEIWSEIKKNRIKNLAELTPTKIRSYLKKLGHSKYYEHASYIIYRINGRKPPTISPEIEEKLKRMFREIQEPFAKVCPKGRKNFLSYSYIFHKFVELLGHDELKELFPLLKSRDKLHQQDIIWEGICKELRLQFIRSV